MAGFFRFYKKRVSIILIKIFNTEIKIPWYLLVYSKRKLFFLRHQIFKHKCFIMNFVFCSIQ